MAYFTRLKDTKFPDSKEVIEARETIIMLDALKTSAADLYKSEKYAEALKIYEKALILDEFNAWYNSAILFNMSMCHYKTENYDQSLQCLNKGLSLNSNNNHKALFKRG